MDSSRLGKRFTESYSSTGLRYTHLEVISENSSTQSKISRVVSHEDDRQYILKSTRLQGEAGRYAEEQLRIMSKIHSEYVVQVVHSQVSKVRLDVYMPYYSNGDLEQYLLKHEVPTARKERMFLDILLGLSELHQLFISHRDLKLNNIFVDVHGRCVIGDLGIAKVNIQGNNSSIGTFGFQAPEVYSFDGTYDEKVDIWAVGIIAFQMFNSKIKGKLRYPFGMLEDLLAKMQRCRPEFQSRLYQQIVSQDYFLDHEIKPFIKQFIYRTVQADPQQRWTWSQVYKDSLIIEGLSQIDQSALNLKPIYLELKDKQRVIKQQQETFRVLYKTYYEPMKSYRSDYIGNLVSSRSMTSSRSVLGKGLSQEKVQHFEDFYFFVLVKMVSAYENVKCHDMDSLLEDMKQFIGDVAQDFEQIRTAKSNQGVSKSILDNCSANSIRNPLLKNYAKLEAIVKEILENAPKNR